MAGMEEKEESSWAVMAAEMGSGLSERAAQLWMAMAERIGQAGDAAGALKDRLADGFELLLAAVRQKTGLGADSVEPEQDPDARLADDAESRRAKRQEQLANMEERLAKMEKGSPKGKNSAERDAAYERALSHHSPKKEKEERKLAGAANFGQAPKISREAVDKKLLAREEKMRMRDREEKLKEKQQAKTNSSSKVDDAKWREREMRAKERAQAKEEARVQASSPSSPKSSKARSPSPKASSPSSPKLANMEERLAKMEQGSPKASSPSSPKLSKARSPSPTKKPAASLEEEEEAFASRVALLDNASPTSPALAKKKRADKVRELDENKFDKYVDQAGY